MHSSMAPFLLLLSLLFCPSLQQPTSSSLHPLEKSALLDIRRGLLDLPGSQFFSTWDFSVAADPCSSFAGVVCSGDGPQRITSLTLGTDLAGLAGILSPSIADLVALSELVVYPGRISGPLPPSLPSGLRLLSISNNLLSGPVPSALFALPNLHTVDLGHNRLHGPIPAGLLLNSLRVLILASNGLSGEIPPEISATELLHLDIRGNNLTGALPPLPATLRYLSAAGNSMSGPLPSPPPPAMEFLDLSLNQFSGGIPPSIFAASPSLSSLVLRRNNLTGPLPENCNVTAGAAVVDLSHNAISGGVPLWLAGAGSLYLNNNRLSGAVPEAYARSVIEGTMTTFYAHHNFLTGFPSMPEPLPETVAVCLSYNCFVPPLSVAGECPASAGSRESRPAYQCRD